jgi:predicted PurR-regulated permease PerM
MFGLAQLQRYLRECVDLHIEKRTLRYIFIAALSCIFLYWILHEPARVSAVWGVISSVFSPFVAGASIAFILNVPMRAFENMLKGVRNPNVRRLIAVCLTIISVLLIIAVVCLLLIPQLVETIRALIPKIAGFIGQVQDWLIKFLQDNQNVFNWKTLSNELAKLDWGSLIQQFLDLVKQSLVVLIPGAVSAIGSLFGAMFDALIAVVFAIYCLFQKENLARQGRKLLYAFLPESAADYIVDILRLANSTFSNFLSGQCVEVCILGTLFAICMAIFRMPYIPLISVVIAVTAFIPVVGAWIGCIVGAFFILVSSPAQAIWFVIMFVILQQLENNLIYPRVVGTSIGLSGMWVLVAVAVGGELMGVAGMFLMIPAASVFYAIMRDITQKRLKNKAINPDKLRAQPPAIKSRFKSKPKATQEKQTEESQQNEN